MIACQTTNHSTIIYSPEEHVFYTEGGERLEVEYDRGPAPSSRSLNLRIVLGRKCNFNCSYCMQGDARENKSLREDLSPHEISSEILRVAGSRDIGGVLFWGGEPLVYFKQMKEIHTQLEPFCSTSRKGNFFVITNGLELRNPEIVKWLIDKRINVTISYDGAAQALRGIDIFMQPAILAAVKSMMQHNPDRVSVLPVLGRVNNSLSKYIEYLHGIFGEIIPQLGHVDITTVVNKEMMGSVIAEGDLSDFSRELADSLCENRLAGWEQLEHKVDDFFSCYAQPGLGGVCAALGEDVLVCDMSGDILFCQNADKTKLSDRTGKPFLLGNIKEIPTSGVLPWAGQDYIEDEKCRRCLVRKLCSGGCWHGQKEFEDYNCKAHYYFNLAFMDYIIYQITGGRLEKVDRVLN